LPNPVSVKYLTPDCIYSLQLLIKLLTPNVPLRQQCIFQVFSNLFSSPAVTNTTNIQPTGPLEALGP